MERESGKSRYYSESAFGPYTDNFQEKAAETIGFFIQDQIRLWDLWITTIGARYDNHDKFGSKWTYRLTTAYIIDKTGTKLKATYGTGFKAPTLYQLYSNFGDENLKAEESIGWDAGVEQSFFNNRVLFVSTLRLNISILANGVSKTSI